MYIGFIFVGGVFKKSKFPSKELQFFAVSLIYLYSFSIYPKWEQSVIMKNTTVSNYDFSIQNKKEKEKEKESKYSLLNGFKFLNSELDTISLVDSNKYTIIETWNERCPPCLSAISGLKDFYKSINDDFKQYYVYKPKNEYFDYEKVFSFKKIGNRDRILIDINLYDKLNLRGYPYFLLFDKKGKLIFLQKGYSEEHKSILQDTISKLLNIIDL